jgi:chemotaxis protein MotA
MDRGTWIGLLLGLALLGLAISLGPNARIFFHPPSMIVVVGGLIASLFIRFPMSQVASAFKVASGAFFHQAQEPAEVVRLLVGLSQRAKREGTKNLEKAGVDDPFLDRGLRMVVDRIEREHIEDALAREIQATQERHMQGQEIFRFIATAAPSFGMVGTLIGMVQLFASIKDPSTVGGAMALSLLSTLYGAVIAYLFAIPIAGKLELRSREELTNKRLMLEGILGIQAEQNPTLLEGQLNSFLAPAKKVRLHAASVG